MNSNIAGHQYAYVPVDVPYRLFGAYQYVESLGVCYKLTADGSYHCYTSQPATPVQLDGSVMVRFMLTYANTAHSIYLGKITMTMVEQ